MQSMKPNRPIEFDIEFPGRQRDRASTVFRPLLAIPVLVVLAALGGPALGGARGGGGLFFIGLASGLVVIPPLLTIVFREKYPRWWFDFNLAFLRFDNRVIGYLLLTCDEYPSTDDEQSVHLDVPYPDVRSDLNRLMPLIKWFRRSALKHGITVEAIEHAVEFVLHWDDDAYESDPPTVLVLGPDQAGNVLEVLAETTGEGELVVFHAMRARSQFLDLLAD